MGRSIGHWDGDTLVVETTGFKVKTAPWLREIECTLDDPTYYTRPWSWVRDYNWRPDMVLFKEYNCELQTGAKGGLDPRMIPEPQD